MAGLDSYRLLGRLGRSELGSVWAAVDTDGERLTMTFLEPPAAADPRWRAAFATTVRALSQPGHDRLPVREADLDAAAPWVACAVEPGPGSGQIFQALGVTYRPEDAPEDPVAPPVEVVASEAGRKPWWVLAVTVGAAVLAVGATAVALARPGSSTVPPGPATGPTATVAAHPGLEPPIGPGWPDWPRFKPGEATTATPGPVALRVPAAWTCATGPGAVTCSGARVRAEVTVRSCPRLCDQGRRAALRRAEEAWGAQWRIGGRFAVYAETARIDGVAAYGLVVVAYGRTVPEDALDRVVVLRLSGPPASTAEIRKVANSLWDGSTYE